MSNNALRSWVYLLVVATGTGCIGVTAWPLPEQRSIDYRDPADLPQARIPESTPVPPTVTRPQPPDSPEWQLSLDEAIRSALENSEVVRVLTGVSAASSGQTIYDPAIASTSIDREQARFDPNFDVSNTFNRVEVPGAVIDPTAAEGARIGGVRTDDYNMNLGLSKTTLAGGTANLGVNTNPTRMRPGIFPLNPQDRSSVETSYTQPLLNGAGIGVNVAPIVIARIDTERSFFRYKDSVQELVRGVIDGYWSIVFARTDVWAREQQVKQGEQAYDREFSRKKVGMGDQADVAQARLALANFRANLISSQGNLLAREAALRNIMGLPPTDQRRLVPTTPPTDERIEFDWKELIRLAEQRRPDLIELKLILEADQQQLLIARNQSLPSVDAVMLYRWNGLEGRTPVGSRLSTDPGQFSDWTLGVNFSVPLGLRQARAAVRERTLVISRDRANLDQGLHAAMHSLAINYRNVDQLHEQYLAFHVTREAARANLEQQIAVERYGQSIFLNVLQAITDWGNAVSSEAQSLTQYNTELANSELETGTILETHGIRFNEERWEFAGPIPRHPVAYPTDIVPTANDDHYPDSDKPAEEWFDLTDPLAARKKRRADKPAVPDPPEAPPYEPERNESPIDAPVPKGSTVGG